MESNLNLELVELIIGSIYSDNEISKKLFLL